MIQNNTNALKGLLILGLIFVLGVVYVILTPTRNIQPSSTVTRTTEDAEIDGTFNLIDMHNNKFSSDNLKNHYSFIYFGYTSCDADCINTLHKLNKVVRSLNKYNIRNIKVVFITIDPTRDTSSKLKTFLGEFNYEVIGLTGTTEQIQNVASNFKVFYKQQQPSNDNNYAIDHSTFIYLMNLDGNYIHHFSSDATIQNIAEYVKSAALM